MTRRLGLWAKKAFAALITVAMLGMLPCESVQAVSANGAIAKGIDVSKHNGAVNWQQVAASGMQFAFIKVGSTYSGIDPQFAANITGAQAAGLKTGVYIYSYATTPEQAINEANLVLQWIEPYTINYPVVFDIEDKCHKSLSSQQMIDIINAFCMTIDAAGYYPMVYSYKNLFDNKLSIAGWDRWVAQYNDTCETNNNVCFWQYSSKGRVNGIGGNVDMNYQYKDYSSLIIPEGFIEHNGNVRFYQNWRMQRGWIGYNDTRYYLDGAGNLVRGWFTDTTGTYYLSPADGSIARGQCNVDGADYYFTAEGIKTSGWVVLNDMKYFYEPANNGIMKREWLSDEKGNFYYFDKIDGHMLTGAQTIDGANFFFSPEGVRMSGMIPREDGSYYYDPATGQMVTGWFAAGNETYYADELGHIVTGVYEINKQPYYFTETGTLLRNGEVELEGVAYTTTPEGVLVQVEAAMAGAVEAQAQAPVAGADAAATGQKAN